MGVAGNYWSSDYTKLSLASMELSVNGQTVRGIVKVTLKETVKRDPAYGNGSVSEGLPAGQHSAEGSVAMFSPSAAALRTIVGGGWSQSACVIAISLFEPNGAGLLHYGVSGAYLTELEADFGEAGGNKPGQETFGLTIIDPIDWDGLPAIYKQGSVGLLPIGIPTLQITF